MYIYIYIYISKQTVLMNINKKKQNSYVMLCGIYLPSVVYNFLTILQINNMYVICTILPRYESFFTRFLHDFLIFNY